MKNLRVISALVMFALVQLTSVFALTAPVDGGVLPQKMALDKAQQAYDAIVTEQSIAITEVKKSDAYQKTLAAFNKAAADVRSKIDASIPKKLNSFVQAALVEFDKPVTDAKAAVDSAQKALNEVMKKYSSKEVQVARQKIVSGVQQSPAYVDLAKQSKISIVDADAAIAALPEKAALDKMVFEVGFSYTKHLGVEKEKVNEARAKLEEARKNASPAQAQK